MKYLFLCNEGKNRAPTAASVARDIARRKGIDIEMVSGGIDTYFGTVNELKEHFSQFDKIFVMEHHIKLEMMYDYGIDEKKVFFIHVHDGYTRDEPELIKIFQDRLEGLIN